MLITLCVISGSVLTAQTLDLHSTIPTERAPQAPEIVWSILIPTITERASVFERIYTKLQQQITQANLEQQIEIIYFRDQKGEHNVGYKRNLLLATSRGKYTCFVDDDDDVHVDYIRLIYDKLQTDPDCVSLTGIISFAGVKGKKPRKFIHSIKYKSYFMDTNLVYYRPPNHLNPIRRSIASQFKFPEQNTLEDTDWAMQICRAGVLKTEAELKMPYYFYLFNINNSVQHPKPAPAK
ncbi:MAG TPA: glycosyltransferase [Candidatus Babeliales bacterium]|nr:glycosyltransferase [Candidatus Babeliales bacterium]